MSWRIPTTKNDYISGYFYYKICDWSVCPRYPQNFDISKIKENDLVFLNLDYFENFINFLNNNSIQNKFILVTQNSDRDFTKNMFSLIDRYVSKVYPINCNFKHEKVFKIPLGFNDHSTETLDEENFDFSKKQNLIYMNFKLHHHSDRPICFDYFKKFNWVDVENEILPLKEFYDKLKTYKYCISPRGTGIDTHRIYESLLYGVIPVVKKSELDDLYENLPVLLVDSWKDVTEEYLINSYYENLSKYFEWKNNNPDWYKSKNWIKK
jgi:hypothetical protein